MRNLKGLVLVGMAALPMVVFGQVDVDVRGRSGAPLTDTQTLIRRVGDLIEDLLIVAAALALLAFLWGLAKFIFKADDSSEHESGKNLMKWGLVALFVMVTVWGIIYFVQRELGIYANDVPDGWWDL